MDLDQFLANMRQASSSYKPTNDDQAQRPTSGTGDKSQPNHSASHQRYPDLSHGTRYSSTATAVPQHRFPGHPPSQSATTSSLQDQGHSARECYPTQLSTSGSPVAPLHPNGSAKQYSGPRPQRATAGFRQHDSPNLNLGQRPPWNENNPSARPRNFNNNPRPGLHTAYHSLNPRPRPPNQYNTWLGPKPPGSDWSDPHPPRPPIRLADPLHPPWAGHPPGPSHQVNHPVLGVPAPPAPPSLDSHPEPGLNIMGAAPNQAAWGPGGQHDSVVNTESPFHGSNAMPPQGSQLFQGGQKFNQTSEIPPPFHGVHLGGQISSSQPFLGGQKSSQPSEPPHFHGGQMASNRPPGPLSWRPPSGPIYRSTSPKLQQPTGPAYQQQQHMVAKAEMRPSEREADQQWITSWLGKLGKKKAPPSKKNIVTISNYRCCLKEAVKLKMELESCVKLMDIADSGEWQQHCERTTAIKTKLQNLNKIISDEDTVSRIQELIAKRRKKREWLKRRRLESYTEKQADTERRLKLHTEIDAQRDKSAQQVLKEKQDREFKANADVILSEVRKKLADISKSSSLLKSLVKLRLLRSEAAKNRGLYLAVGSDEVFNTKTEEMLQLLEQQKKTYLMEENTLKVMLEIQQEETKEREQEQAKRIQADRDRKRHRKLCVSLFGKDEPLDIYNPMTPFMQYYTQAEASLEALIQVRHGWDMYLVPSATPGASGIPEDWVWPCDPSDDQWASTLT